MRWRPRWPHTTAALDCQHGHELVVNRCGLGADRLIHLGVRANCAAVTADTSSAAAGTTPVVGAAAAAFWAVNAEPILAKSPAAVLSISGCVVTKDMDFSFRKLSDRETFSDRR